MTATTRADPAEASGFELRELLAETVRRLETDHPTIAAEMHDLLAASIDDLRGDRQLGELLRASIESNLSTIFHMMVNDIGLQALQPPTAAIEYAHRLAQRDVPLSALTRAYYLAQSMFLRVALEEVEQLELPEGTKIEAVRGVANAIHSYIDWMLQRVTEAYGAEHRRWWSARATVNTSTILKVLRGEASSARSFAAETRYDIEQRHLAMIAWSADPAGGVDAQHRLDHVVRKAATLLGSPHTPLATAVDPTTMWAWVAMPSAQIEPAARRAIDALVAESTGVRLALGGIAEGPAGFRRSHEQAAGARHVALTAGRYRSVPVVSDADPNIALASILLRDQPATLAWMRQVLGAIAEPGETNAAVRETLRVFYATGRNSSRTAELTGVHRNTVHRRVTRFEAGHPGSASTDELEVALALRVYDTFVG